jgi:RimJ/RimL family protein N-acetyltransferase
LITVHQITAQDWRELGPNAHLAVFSEKAPPSQDRMDFALLTIEEDTNDVLAYVTCRELDPETLYWGYGGSFPTAKNSSRSWGAYRAMTDKSFSLGYKHIFTLIENKNKVMLKFASKIGYTIVGIRHVNGCTMLEHVLEVADAHR